MLLGLGIAISVYLKGFSNLMKAGIGVNHFPDQQSRTKACTELPERKIRNTGHGRQGHRVGGSVRTNGQHGRSERATGPGR